MNFTEKYRMMRWMALKYSDNTLYEPDELINQAWLSRHVREARDAKRLFSAIRYAFLGYFNSFKKFARPRRRFIEHKPLDFDIAYIQKDEVELADEIDWLRAQLEILDDREKIVLRHILGGLTNREIQVKMGVSKETVRKARVSGFNKIREIRNDCLNR